MPHCHYFHAVYFYNNQNYSAIFCFTGSCPPLSSLTMFLVGIRQHLLSLFLLICWLSFWSALLRQDVGLRRYSDLWSLINMTWRFCPHRNIGKDFCLLLPIIRTKQACRYCIPGESSSRLYPAENTEMNGAVGPEIRQVTICLRFWGGEGVWLVAHPWSVT